ncbi:MAG: CHRD domain-containing protein [Gemmatimonadales bacterium]
MSIRISGLAISAALLAAGVHSAPAQSVKYVAQMGASSETPPNDSKATGTAKFSMTGNRVTFTIDVSGLSGPPAAAHIHVGAPGQSGPVVYAFMLTHKEASGRIASGVIDLSKPASRGVSGDSLRTLLNNGNAYVNVHTAAHPDGEIRGQITKQ